MADRIQAVRLKKLLHRMVDIYSPSGKEEDLLDYLRGYLKRRGLPAVAQPVDENRYNLLVLPTTDDEAELAFIGHVDTVPAYDLERFGCAESGDAISGLGTADMKGGCAAMIEAFVCVQESGLPGPPAALCLVVGEEESGDGAARLLKDHHFPWAIIGEPTNLICCLECFGYAEVQLAAAGRRLHPSMADPQRSAIQVLLARLMRLAAHIEASRPGLIYNIRDLFSSPSGFAVPERCESWLDIHLPPDADIAEILTEIEEICIDGTGNSGTDLEFRIESIDAGYRLPEKGPVVEALKNALETIGNPWLTGAFRSHSDANQIWTAGVKPILLGPGMLETAHTEDESISFEQVCRAAEIYLEVLRSFGR